MQRRTCLLIAALVVFGPGCGSDEPPPFADEDSVDGDGESTGGDGESTGGTGEPSGDAGSGGAGSGVAGGDGDGDGLCQNGEKDRTETDVDCGGTSECPRCAVGKVCWVDEDCETGFCAENECAEPTCDDHTTNGDETDVDCGNGCRVCVDEFACSVNEDCLSRICTAGKCEGSIRHAVAFPTMSTPGVWSDFYNRYIEHRSPGVRIHQTFRSTGLPSVSGVILRFTLDDRIGEAEMRSWDVVINEQTVGQYGYVTKVGMGSVQLEFGLSFEDSPVAGTGANGDDYAISFVQVDPICPGWYAYPEADNEAIFLQKQAP